MTSVHGFLLFWGPKLVKIWPLLISSTNRVAVTTVSTCTTIIIKAVTTQFTSNLFLMSPQCSTSHTQSTTLSNWAWLSIYPQKCPFLWGGSRPPPNIWFLGPHKSTPQTACWSVQHFCRGHALDQQRVRYTDQNKINLQSTDHIYH